MPTHHYKLCRVFFEGTKLKLCINLLHNFHGGFASNFSVKLLTNFSPEIQVGVDKLVYTKCMQEVLKNSESS